MKHYDISYAGKEEDYRGHGYGERHIPHRDEGHVIDLLFQYSDAISQDENAMNQSGVSETRDGYYLQFLNTPGYDLMLDCLDRKTIGHIVSISESETESGKTTSAILYLKKEKKSWFSKKAQEYRTKTTKNGNKKNAPLIDSIDEVRPVTMDKLWVGKGPMPAEEKEWVEVWFEENCTESAKEKISSLGIEYKEQCLEFPERVVLMVRANKSDLEGLFYSSGSLIKITQAPTLAGFIVDEQGPEQRDWMNMIMGQFKFDQINNRKYLCLLDSGIVNSHPLLQPVLSDNDRFAVDSNWGTNDTWPHGTLMAGIAAYGDMKELLENGPIIEPTYRLCSVKVTYNRGNILKELWGKYTKQGVSIAEIGRGQMPEILAFCMAISERDGYTDGTPSSWSGAIDQICSGADDGTKRLFVQCAGNITNEQEWAIYPDSNRTLGIQNPGQAWNALTVGAFTDKTRAFDSQGQIMNVVAPEGGLSPYSTTSGLWASKTPIKPEILMEGGNIAVDSNRHYTKYPDLELLTTSNLHMASKYFTTINATSAATALAARFASLVLADNPEYWPETIKGLFIHTAQWTDQMIHSFPSVDERLRMCGYGVPNLEKMQSSRANSVTFIAQKTIQPYKKDNRGYSFNQMHIYTLPWPKDTLLELGEQEVKLTVTLSYFVEPGPTDNYSPSFNKYNYASAGLRFDLSTYRDTARSFKSRILREYDEDDMRVPNDTRRWGIGVKNRTKGSIHKDWIKCTAADLAKCNMIAVFPVSGWWYNRRELNRINNEMRYSLIVSLESGEEQVDFSTEINNRIQIEQQVVIET